MIVINEIMQNPDAVGDTSGEWFEVTNTGSSDIDINGWTIRDNGAQSHIINNGGPLIVPPGGFLVLGRNADVAANGGVVVDYEFSGIVLGNADDELILIDTAGNEIDRVEYDGGPNFPDPTGASMSLSSPTSDNNTGSSWFESSVITYGDGDFGTPGAPNECFVTGTLIATANGEVAVEDLKVGDVVQTAGGQLEAIKWMGRQTVKPEDVQNPMRGYPILVKAGALGNSLPVRDLYVSPDHALLVEGLLINAGALVNSTSIIQTEPTDTFTYFHIELKKHALLIAEGTFAESYLPQREDRDCYDNAAEYSELYPEGPSIMLWPLEYPRVSSYTTVPRYIRQRLQAVANELYSAVAV